VLNRFELEFFSTVIGSVDTFLKCTVFGTVDTFLAVLLDISVTFLKCTLSKNKSEIVLKFILQLPRLTLNCGHWSIIEWFTF